MTDYRLSWHLRRACGAWISREELAEAMDDPGDAGGRSQEGRPGRDQGNQTGRHRSAAVPLSSALEVLRRQGFVIDEHPLMGVRLTAAPSTLDRDELVFACRGRSIGRRIMVYQETSSTNDVAAHVAQGGPSAHGTVIIAESQTAGRGRQGAPWLDAPGQSLLLSIPLWLSKPPMLAAATALADAIEEVSGLDIGIKWPNDLEIERRKLAGILIEGLRGSAEQAGGGLATGKTAYVFGAGINVNQPASAFPAEIRERATSLYIAGGKAVDRTLLLERILAHLDLAVADLEAGREATLRQRYDAHSDMVGRVVEVVEGGRGYRGEVVSISPQ